MNLSRTATCLISGLVICVSGLGCTSLDTFIGSGIAVSNPADRLVPIARVFERQGRIEEATAMYRKALQADPDNVTALARINHLEQMSRPRIYRGGAQDASAFETQIARSAVPSVREEAAKTAAVELEVAAVEPTQSAVDTTARVNLFSLTHEIEDFTEVDTAARMILVDTTGRLTLFDDQDAVSDQEVQFATDDDLSGHLTLAAVTQVAASEVDAASDDDSSARLILDEFPASKFDNTVTTAGATLDELQMWVESPNEYISELLDAVRQGADPETQALAAAALAETADGRRVSLALQLACRSENSLLAATACDAVLKHDGASDFLVDRLLGLADESDSQIRGQVVATLRRLSGTKWSRPAVETLADRMHDQDASVRAMAALTLGDFAGESATALDCLAERFETEDDEQVIRAIELATERLDGSRGTGDIIFGKTLPFAD